MPKLILTDVTNLKNGTAVTEINDAFLAIETALENTLSRDGTSPNFMTANLDMNSKRILNLPKATSATEPIRKAEFDAAVTGIGDVMGKAYECDEIDSSCNGATVTFHLKVAGVNLTSSLAQGAKFFVTVNGMLLEEDTDYVINTATDDTLLTFTEAPESGDNPHISFIRFQIVSFDGDGGDGGTGGTSGGPGGIDIVTSTPTSCSVDGKPIYNDVDKKLYICKDGVYVDIFQAFTPDAPPAVSIVDSVPPSCSLNGDAVYDRTTGYLYICKDGVYVTASQALTPDAPAGIELFTSDPGTANFEGRTYFNTSTNKLRKYTSSAWTDVVVSSTTTTTITDGSVTTPKLAANAITSDKIAANAIIAGKIQAGAIGTTELAAGAITAAKIASNSITAGLIQAGAIGTSQLAAGAITADKLAANAVVIGSAQIAEASITTLKLAGESVIIPRAYTWQPLIYGNNSAQNIAQVNFTLPTTTGCTFICICNHAYLGSIPDTSFYMLLNGATVIAGLSAGGGAAQASPAMCAFRSLSAGSHYVQVFWTGTTAAVAVGNISLIMLGAMR